MTFDKIKLNQNNHSIKKVKCPPDGLTKSDFGSKEKDINDNLVNKDYLAENVTVDDEMICQYSGLPSLKSYKKNLIKTIDMKKNKSIQDMIIDGELTRRQAITAIKNKLRRKSELMIMKDGKKKKL